MPPSDDVKRREEAQKSLPAEVARAIAMFQAVAPMTIAEEEFGLDVKRWVSVFSRSLGERAHAHAHAHAHAREHARTLALSHARVCARTLAHKRERACTHIQVAAGGTATVEPSVPGKIRHGRLD